MLSLEFVDLYKEMETNCVFMKQFAGDKLPKDTIYNRFFGKLSVLCLHWFIP